jgi:hypothetical protein
MLKGGHPMFTLDQVLSILQDAYDSGGNFQDAFERLYLYLISSNPIQIQTIRRRRRNFQISWIYNFHSFPPTHRYIPKRKFVAPADKNRLIVQMYINFAQTNREIVKILERRANNGKEKEQPISGQSTSASPFAHGHSPQQGQIRSFHTMINNGNGWKRRRRTSLDGVHTNSLALMSPMIFLLLGSQNGHIQQSKRGKNLVF